MRYEYKVVPAPTRGKKAKGVKTPAARFANALSAVMNELAADGWDYLRTDTLPSQERSGLTGRTTVFQNMLVFRRAVEVADAAVAAQVLAEATAPGPAPAEPAHEEIAAVAAPRLPSAEAAQSLPETPAPAPAPREPRDVAAE